VQTPKVLRNSLEVPRNSTSGKFFRSFRVWDFRPTEPYEPEGLASK
jgi:hypothetical protein